MTMYECITSLDYTMVYRGSFVEHEGVDFIVAKTDEWLQVTKLPSLEDNQIYYLPKAWLMSNLVAFINGLLLPSQICKGFISNSFKDCKISSEVYFGKIRILVIGNSMCWGFVLDNLMATKVAEALTC